MERLVQNWSCCKPSNYQVKYCSRHYFKPRYPDIDGQDQFQGLQLHTKSYRVPSIFKDKNVLLIGFGPSGQDIADDVSKEALTVSIPLI